MGTAYLLDTNVVIYYLDALLPVKAINFIEEKLYSTSTGFVQNVFSPSSPPSAVRRGRGPFGAFRPKPLFAQNLLQRSINETGSFISIISKIELLGWQAPTDEAMKMVGNFVKDSTTFPLNDPIAEKTIRIQARPKNQIA